ncbi:MAG: hypothetical protein WC460_05435 [Patescibacteria group bacterium]
MKSLKTVLVLATAFFLTVTIASCSPEDDSAEINGIGVDAASVSQINVWLLGSDHTDGFKLERSTDGIFYSQIADVGYDHDLGYITYEDKDLYSETYYYYRAYAYNGHDESSYDGPVATRTLFDGYGMCTSKTAITGFPCLPTRCQHLRESEFIYATGADVLECLSVGFTAPATMTVLFAYKASASTCFNEPYLQISTGSQTQDYSFSCNSPDSIVTGPATGILVINIDAGQTIDDLNFVLASGDWGSSVCIKSITFAP